MIYENIVKTIAIQLPPCAPAPTVQYPYKVIIDEVKFNSETSFTEVSRRRMVNILLTI